MFWTLFQCDYNDKTLNPCNFVNIGPILISKPEMESWECQLFISVLIDENL